MPELDETTDETDGPTAEDFAALRHSARLAPKLQTKLTAAEEELVELRREVAFTRAGLDLSPKQQAALLAAHDGELSADALRATAVELGFAAVADDGQQVRDQALAGITKVSAATTGANPPPAQPPIADRIIQAEQAKDWQAAAQLKAQMVVAAARSNGGTVSFT